MAFEILNIQNGMLKSAAEKADIECIRNGCLDIKEISAFIGYAKENGCQMYDILQITNKVIAPKEQMNAPIDNKSFWGKTVEAVKKFARENPIISAVGGIALTGLAGYGLYKGAAALGLSLGGPLGCLLGIGIATAVLSSCVDGNSIAPDIDDMEPANIQAKQSVKHAQKHKQSDSLSEQTNNMLNSLGLFLDDSTSIENMNTIGYFDSKGLRHHIQQKGVRDDILCFESMSLDSSDSPKDRYISYVTTSKNEGIDVKRIYSLKGGKEYNTDSEKNEEVQNYVLNDDGSITEYDVLENGVKVEKSTYKRQEDGNILRTYTNGETVVYDKVTNNLPFPIPIVFSATIIDSNNIEKQE